MASSSAGAVVPGMSNRLALKPFFYHKDRVLDMGN